MGDYVVTTQYVSLLRVSPLRLIIPSDYIECSVPLASGVRG